MVNAADEKEISGFIFHLKKALRQTAIVDRKTFFDGVEAVS